MTPGSVLADRFVVERRAGSGGMGAVFRALDRVTGEHVALKTALGREPEIVERFLREAEVVAKLRHPGIVRHVAHGEDAAAGAWLAMEWLEGHDLAAALERGPLALEATVTLALRCAEALAAAHAAGVVHRDIKPANLFLPGGDPARSKILDFGIARTEGARTLTRTGALIGTPAYMAPEQARGDPGIDARVDVYALGCVLFECLAGRPAFAGEHALAVLGRVLFESAPRLAEARPEAPAWLADLVGSMLAKDRLARPANGAAVLEALRAAGPAAHRPAVIASQRPPPLAGEQRVASVVLVGARAAGPSDPGLQDTVAIDDVGAAREAIEEAVRAHDASFEVLRDGSMVVVVGGAGEATDRAVRAARCAVALRAHLPDAPIAVATGRGELASSHGLGDVLDRAAALIARAPRRAPKAILVDATSASLLRLRFALVPLPGPGEPGAILAFERAGDDVRPLLGKRTRCVGRERDLNALVAHVDECADEGIARMVVVTAAPGVGKTRLRQELLLRLGARPSLSPWLASGDAGRLHAAFGVAAGLVRSAADIAERDAPALAGRVLRDRLSRVLSGDALARAAALLGEILSLPGDTNDPVLAAARSDPKVMGEQTRRSWEEWLAAEAASGPVLLVIDDLHWADAPSVELLGRALAALPDRPLVIVCFARPEVRGAFPALFSARNVHEHRLSDLGRRACEALVTEVLGAGVEPAVVARIAERCAGNAFYLEELIRSAAEGGGGELPESVLAMVDRRLARLSADARAVLRAASVFGERFHEGAVAALVPPAIAGRVGAELAGLAAEELITPRSDSRFPGQAEHAFRHALLRDGAYATLLDDDRRAAHAIAARWLAAAGEDDAAAIGEHHERAGEAAEAAACFVRAARQAYARNDFAGALGLLARAQDLGASGLVLGELLATRGKVHGALGAWDDSFAALSAALPQLEGAPDAARADALVDAGYACFWRQDGEGILALGVEAADLSRRAARADLETDALALVAIGHTGSNVELALDWLARALARSGGRHSKALAQAAQVLYHSGRLADAVAVTRAIAGTARAAHDTATLVLALANHGLALAGSGAYASASQAFEEAQDLGRRAGAASLLARAASMETGLYVDLDDLDRAEAIAERAAELAAAAGFIFPLYSSRIDLLFVAVRRGDVPRAEERARWLEEALRHASGTHGWLWQQRYGVACAELALAKGDAAAAARRATLAVDLTERFLRPKYRALALQVRARARRALGDEGAAADARLALTIARGLGDPALHLRAARTALEIAPRDRDALADLEEVITRIAAALPDEATRSRFLARNGRPR
jgi:hypothetical protein